MPLRITLVTLLFITALENTIAHAYGQQVHAHPTTPLRGTTARVASRLTGTVTNSTTGKAIAYASVVVLTEAGTTVNGGVCGEDGQFVLLGIPPGAYTLRVSFLGYQDLTRSGVVVPEGGGTVGLDILSLTAAAQKLGEVLAMAQKSLIEEKVDRTVYHAENNQAIYGGDATDVLKRVPLLSVDLDGNVSLRGS